MTPYRVLEVERVLRIILKVLGWRVLQIIVQNAEAQRQAALDRHTDTCRAPQLKCIGVLNNRRQKNSLRESDAAGLKRVRVLFGKARRGH